MIDGQCSRRVDRTQAFGRRTELTLGIAKDLGELSRDGIIEQAWRTAPFEARNVAKWVQLPRLVIFRKKKFLCQWIKGVENC